MDGSPVVFLVDNGSLQPAATLRLRAIARELSVRLKRPVEPVSLLHSSAIDPELLDGVPAEILEPAIRRRCQAGARRFLIVPLFFGPSAALNEYIPERVRAWTTTWHDVSVRVAAPLVDPNEPVDRRLIRILADHVRRVRDEHVLASPWVVVVDHGSPQPAVAKVRDLVAAELRAELGSDVRAVAAASMERREGDAYAFNEPLLERALTQVEGEGVLALLFFSPGRHAGPGGDIATICAEAERMRPGLKVHLTPLVGEHHGLVEILADRATAAL